MSTTFIWGVGIAADALEVFTDQSKAAIGSDSALEGFAEVVILLCIQRTGLSEGAFGGGIEQTVAALLIFADLVGGTI